MQASSIALDTSVIVAIALGEPERDIYLKRLTEASEVLISTPTVLEARIVIYHHLQARGWMLLDRLLDHPRFSVTAPSMSEIEIATQAFVIYGKGNGHKAQLNFGDLFSYALAKSRKIPLLFKGEDFAHTDVASALSA